MKILAVAQVEDRTNLDKQILKQTVQPEKVIFLEDGNPVEGINARRVRIAENHKKLQDIVKAYQPDLVWQLEQDSVLPEDCLERLIETYNSNVQLNLGYVSGIQIGRHGIRAIGAWHIFKDAFESVDKNNKGLVEVDATGFYCLLAKRETWLEGIASWDGEPWGPDVNWGLSIKDKGYIILVDMDLPIGHDTGKEIQIGPDKGKTRVLWPSEAENVRFEKEGESWKYKTRN